MKALVVLVLVQIISINAWSVFKPGWDRPIAMASDVEVIEAGGSLIELEDIVVTLNRVDGNPSLRTVTLNLNFQMVELVLEKSEEAGCGSQKLILTEKTSKAESRVSLSIIDHKTRLCDDYKKYQWEMELSENNGKGEVLGRAQLGANPEAVYTILGGRPPIAEAQIEQQL